MTNEAKKRGNGNNDRMEFKTTYLSSKGIRVLGEHALGLPVGSPARGIITLLIERWVKEGRVVTFVGNESQTDLELNDDLTADDFRDLMEEAA